MQDLLQFSKLQLHVFFLYEQGRLRRGAGGARIALHTELLPSLLSAEEALFGTIDSLVQENFSGGKPPNPQMILVLLGDQCIRHCSSGKEFKDQKLALWRSIYMHRFSLIGGLAPCPRYVQASLYTKAIILHDPHFS